MTPLPHDLRISTMVASLQMADVPPMWRHALVAHGPDFADFWREYLEQPGVQITYIHALGFDPRTTAFLGLIGESEQWVLNRILRFELDYGGDSKDIAAHVAENRKRLETLYGQVDIEVQVIPIAKPEHEGEGSAIARRAILEFCRAQRPAHVVIDLNAMPKSIGMTVVAAALDAAGEARSTQAPMNVHVIVNHNPDLDELIQQVEVHKDAFLMAGFLEGFDTEGQNEEPGIWMPILGPGQEAQLDAIKSQAWAPSHLSPVVPSPAQRPRKGDDLILEYQEFLLGAGAVRGVPRNVLRVSEDDPLEAYEEMVDTIREYGEAYQPLGGCRVLVSAHSTKLLSLAGLMAVYDARRRALCRGVSFAFVEASGHHMVEDAAAPAGTPYTLWLEGKPYV